jgi:hypothetical protein
MLVTKQHEKKVKCRLELVSLYMQCFLQASLAARPERFLFGPFSAPQTDIKPHYYTLQKERKGRTRVTISTVSVVHNVALQFNLSVCVSNLLQSDCLCIVGRYPALHHNPVPVHVR